VTVSGILQRYYAQIRPENFSAFQATIDPQQYFALDLSKWPMSLRAKINGEKLSRNVGNKLATVIKKRLRQGVDARGQAIQQPINGGKPMNRTGELIRSIRWKDGWVAPSWYRKRQEKVTRAKAAKKIRDRRTGKMVSVLRTQRVETNFALMIVLQTTGGEYKRRHQARKRNGEPYAHRGMLDLMGSDLPETRTVIEQLVRRELQRQLDAGEAGLVAELRSIAARSKRLAKAAARRGT